METKKPKPVSKHTLKMLRHYIGNSLCEYNELATTERELLRLKAITLKQKQL